MLSVGYAGKNAYRAGKTSGVLGCGASGTNGVMWEGGLWIGEFGSRK